MTKPTAQTDEELIQATLQGNLSAFEALVVRYQKSLYRTTLRILKDVDEAEDATQETFVRAFKNLQNLKPGATFRPWFYRIAKNYCLDCLKEKSRVIHLEEDYLVAEKDEYEEMAKKEEAGRLRKALQRLPNLYRLPILGFYFSNLNYKQLSLALGIPLNTVRTRIRRGRLMLGGMLAT